MKRIILLAILLNCSVVKLFPDAENKQQPLKLLPKEEVLKKIKEISELTNAIHPLVKAVGGLLEPMVKKAEDPKAKKAGEILLASARLGSSALQNIPPIIGEVIEFPDKARETAAFLSKNIKTQENLKKAGKEIDQETLDNISIGVANLSIIITNIMYKIMKIVKQVGPLVKTLDSDLGENVSTVLNTLARIMKQISLQNNEIVKRITNKKSESDQKDLPALPKPEDPIDFSI